MAIISGNLPTEAEYFYSGNNLIQDNLGGGTGGANWYPSVGAATTADITLSGTQTIDGVALVAGDIVLVKDQADKSQNGIYTVAAGAWTRISALDSGEELSKKPAVRVTGGTANGSKNFVQITPAPIVLGTTAIVWTQFGDGTPVPVADEGVIQANNVTEWNFTGAGVTATNASGKVTVNVPSAGEANTASNLGTGADGAALFTTKDGVNLPFKRIKAGTNVTITEQTNSVTINATGGGGGSVTPSTDATLGGVSASDSLISSQKAVKTYVDTKTAALENVIGETVTVGNGTTPAIPAANETNWKSNTVYVFNAAYTAGTAINLADGTSQTNFESGSALKVVKTGTSTYGYQLIDAKDVASSASLATATTTLTGTLNSTQETALADNTAHRNTTTGEVWFKIAGTVIKTTSINDYPAAEFVIGKNDIRTDFNIKNGSEQADTTAMIAALPSLKANLNSASPLESIQHKIVVKSGVYNSNFIFDTDTTNNKAAQGLVLEGAGNRQMTVLAGAANSTTPIVKVTDTTIAGGDPLATSNTVTSGANAKTQGFELNNLTILGDNTSARPLDVFSSGFRSKNVLVQSVKKPVRFKYSGTSNGGNDPLFSRINTESLVEGLTVRFNRGSSRVALADYATLLTTTPAANTFYTTPKDRIVNGDHSTDTTAKDRFHVWVWDDTLPTPAFALKQVLWAEDVTNAAALPSSGTFNGKIYRLRDNKELRMWDGAASTYRTIVEASPNAALIMNGSLLEIEQGDGRYASWNLEDPRGHGIIVGTDGASSKFSNGHIYGNSPEQRAGYYQKAGSLYSYGNDMEGDYGSSILAQGGNFSVADKHYNFDLAYEVLEGNNFFTSNVASLFVGFAKLGRTLPGGTGNKTAFGNLISNNRVDWKRNRNDGKTRSPYYWFIDNHNAGNWWNVIEGIVGEMPAEFIVRGETNQTVTTNDVTVDIIKETEEFRRNRNWYDIRLFKFTQGKGFALKNDPALGVNFEGKVVFDNGTSGAYTHTREFPQQVVAFGSTLTGNRTITLSNTGAVAGDVLFLNFKNVNFAGFTAAIVNAASTTLATVPKPMMVGLTFNGTQWVLDTKEVADNIYFDAGAATYSMYPMSDFVLQTGTVKTGTYFTNGNDGETQFINLPAGQTATLVSAPLFCTASTGTSPAMVVKLQKINLAGVKTDLITYNVAANVAQFTAINGTVTTTTADLVLAQGDRVIVDIGSGAGATPITGFSLVIAKPVVRLT
jgi:hypothetical protein